MVEKDRDKNHRLGCKVFSIVRIQYIPSTGLLTQGECQKNILDNIELPHQTLINWFLSS